MYTVLMPVDESEKRAAAQTDAAIDLPRADEEVKVRLLHVFDSEEDAETATTTQVSGGEVARSRLSEAGIEVESATRYGDPATEILDATEEFDPDLILLGGRKRSPFGSLLFGSVSQAVTLDATRPVAVTGEAEDTEKPSHRCASCGEEYFSRQSVEITSCRSCGGFKVEVVE